MKIHYKTICISDVHLGTRDCKADFLIDFLKSHTCDNLFLVGDIIDGWKIQQNKLKWKKSHTNVISKILKMAKNGTKVSYVTGNHDEFLRPFVSNMNIGNIRICNHAEYRDIDGSLHLITHGDIFDSVTRLAPWLAFLGDRGYDFLLWFNTKFNSIRHKFGMGYWSISKYLKHNVKKAVGFIFKFEEVLAGYCSNRNYDGVICGHIHSPEIKIIQGIKYMNCGDWVETCSALVEHDDGTWEIIYWNHIKKNEELYNLLNVKDIS